MNQMRGPGKKDGVALVTALLVLALAAIVAAGLSLNARIDIRRAQNLLWRDQAKQFLLGAESWAASQLDDDLAANGADHLGEDWAVAVPALPIEGGYVLGRIVDLHGRFNLNNMIDPDEEEAERAIEQFRRLLYSLELQPGIADAVADWLDADHQMRFPDGAEDDSYQRLTPAYRAADYPMLSITELQAVQGVTAEVYQLLAPHVAALPSGTAINLNTASVPVLQSLAPDVDRATAERILQMRGDGGLADMEEVVELLGGEVPVSIGLSSTYFQLEAQAVVGSLPVSLYSLLGRTGGLTRPLLRSLDTF
jgi:general secretion pathway protein K